MLNLFSNINLPFYIVITFFFAYIIWSKFLKDDKLIPKNIDDILNLFGIFICLFIFFVLTVIFLTSIIMILLDFFDLELFLQKIYNGAPFMVAAFSLVGIWFFACHYANEKCSKDDLIAKLNYIIVYLVFLFFSFSLTICVLILYTPLFYFLKDIIVILSIVIFLIIICYLTVNNILFEIDLRTLIFNKLVFTIALSIGIAITYLFWLSIPQFSYNEQINEKYHIYKSDPLLNEIYLQAKIPIDVKTFGLIGSYVSLIEIPYEQYGFETEGNGGKNFRILINSTKEYGTPILIDGFDEIKDFKKKTENKFSFVDAILLENKGVMLLQFNPDTIRDEDIKTIILEGYIKKNMTDINSSYHLTDYCNTDGCNFTFNIKNNLDLPVYHYKRTIVNLNNRDITNTSKCRLTKLTSTYSSDDNIIMYSLCNDISCQLKIRDANVYGSVFDIEFYIIDKNVVKLTYIDMKRPIDINIQLELEC